MLHILQASPHVIPEFGFGSGGTASLEFFWQQCFPMSLRTAEGESPRVVQVPPANLLPGQHSLNVLEFG